MERDGEREIMTRSRYCTSWARFLPFCLCILQRSHTKIKHSFTILALSCVEYENHSLVLGTEC